MQSVLKAVNTLDAQSQAVSVRQALVDQGPYEAPPGLHVLDEQSACAKTR
jgi:hypothetical protein